MKQGDDVMPNHVPCVLIVEGEHEAVSEFVEFAKGPDPKQKLGAMERRWLVEDGKDPDCQPEIVELFQANKFIPMPPEVMAETFHEAGADWCRNNWGTKWGCYDQSFAQVGGDGTAFAVYTFNCAWSPCLPVIDAAAARYPQLRFYLRYTDPYDDLRHAQEWQPLPNPPVSP